MSYKANWLENRSKLNNVELIKIVKDGLDVIETIINEYSKQGYASITEDVVHNWLPLS